MSITSIFFVARMAMVGPCVISKTFPNLWQKWLSKSRSQRALWKRFEFDIPLIRKYIRPRETRRPHDST